jgi:hypothetical protein
LPANCVASAANSFEYKYHTAKVLINAAHEGTIFQNKLGQTINLAYEIQYVRRDSTIASIKFGVNSLTGSFTIDTEGTTNIITHVDYGDQFYNFKINGDLSFLLRKRWGSDNWTWSIIDFIADVLYGTLEIVDSDTGPVAKLSTDYHTSVPIKGNLYWKDNSVKNKDAGFVINGNISHPKESTDPPTLQDKSTTVHIDSLYKFTITFN